MIESRLSLLMAGESSVPLKGGVISADADAGFGEALKETGIVQSTIGSASAPIKKGVAVALVSEKMDAVRDEGIVEQGIIDEGDGLSGVSLVDSTSGEGVEQGALGVSLTSVKPIELGDASIQELSSSVSDVLKSAGLRNSGSEVLERALGAQVKSVAVDGAGKKVSSLNVSEIKAQNMVLATFGSVLLENNNLGAVGAGVVPVDANGVPALVSEVVSPEMLKAAAVFAKEGSFTSSGALFERGLSSGVEVFKGDLSVARASSASSGVGLTLDAVAALQDGNPVSKSVEYLAGPLTLNEQIKSVEKQVEVQDIKQTSSLAKQQVAESRVADLGALIRRSVQEGITSLKINLSPSELGSVEVRVVDVNGELTLKFKAEKPETLDLLSENQGALDDLMQSGDFNESQFLFGGDELSLGDGVDEDVNEKPVSIEYDGLLNITV